MTDAADVEYNLISATRYDDSLLDVAWNTRVNGGTPSRFMLLPYHFDRLAAAADEHGWIVSRRRIAWADLAAACDDAVIAARPQHGNGPFKVNRKSCVSDLFANEVRFVLFCPLKAHSPRLPWL